MAKVIGVKNPTTVKNYLEYIENTYLLFSLSKIDCSVKAQLRNPKKVYAIDNALVSRLGFHFSGEEGRLLENMVYIELRRRGGEIFIIIQEIPSVILWFVMVFVLCRQFRFVTYWAVPTPVRGKSAAFGMLWIHTIFWKEQ